jgi:hypothetical protein
MPPGDRASPEVAQQRLEGDEVAVPSEAGDDAEADGGEHRRVAERLPSVDVRQVRLDDDEAGTGDGVAQGDAVVREGAGVEDHTVDVAAGLVQPADELALDVRLEVDDGDVSLGGVDPEVGDDVGQRVVAVDLRLPGSEEVEVRSVEDENSSRHGYTVSSRP